MLWEGSYNTPSDKYLSIVHLWAPTVIRVPGGKVPGGAIGGATRPGLSMELEAWPYVDAAMEWDLVVTRSVSPERLSPIMDDAVIQFIDSH